MSKIAVSSTEKEIIRVSAKKAVPLAIKQATGASGGGNINITPYITMDGSSVVFNYFTPKQMEKVYMWLEGGNLWFELTKDEEGQYSLTTKCDIQELDGMFIVGGEEFIVNTIVDSFIVDLKGYNVSEVRIEGIDADLLDADFTWKLAEIGNKLDNIKLPEIDTTELAKQGENQEATNSKILEEVQNKLTPLEAVLTELNHGKQEIASSINFKGTETNAEKSLSELALDIRKIQNVSKEFQTIDYMEDVVGMRSAMEFINDVATNDYAAYACYVLGAGSKFNVATNPNAMYLSDGTLIQSPNGEYEVIPYDGNSYGAVVLAYTGRAVLMENLSSAIQLGLYGAKIDISSIPSNVQFFFTKDCELNITAQAFNNSSIYDFFNSDIKRITNWFMAENKVVRNVNLPDLTSVVTDLGIFYNCTSLMTVNLPKLSIVNIGASKGLFQNCTKLKSVYLSNLTNCPFRFCQAATTLEYCYVPKMRDFNGNAFYECSKLREIYAPSLDSFSYSNMNTLFTSCTSLENIVVGALNVNINFSSWNPLSVLDKIDVNIRNNIALRIADRKDSAALTITFSQNVRNVLSAETEAVFAAKNWNISPAKSV